MPFLEIRVSDPLSKTTRGARRSLLGISAISIAIVKSGIIPTKISALGIEFSETNRSAILLLLAGIIIYYLIEFLIYAASDLIAWHLSIRSTTLKQWDEIKARIEKEGHEKFTEDKSARDAFMMSLDLLPGKFSIKFLYPISYLRTTFEFFVPVIIAFYAIGNLFSTKL